MDGYDFARNAGIVKAGCPTQTSPDLAEDEIAHNVEGRDAMNMTHSQMIQKVEYGLPAKI